MAEKDVERAMSPIPQAPASKSRPTTPGAERKSRPGSPTGESKSRPMSPLGGLSSAIMLPLAHHAVARLPHPLLIRQPTLGASDFPQGPMTYNPEVTPRNTNEPFPPLPVIEIPANPGTPICLPAPPPRNPERELRKKKEFLIRLCQALHFYGATTHRTEGACSLAAQGLEVKAHFLMFPTSIIISFPQSHAETLSFLMWQSLHCEKLARVDSLARKVGEGVLGWEDGSQKLDEIINQQTRYTDLLRIICLGLIAVTLCGPFFGGKFSDSVCAFFLGNLAGVLNYFAGHHERFAKVFSVATSTLISLLARLVGAYVLPATQPLCFIAVVLPSIVWLLQGLSLTLAVIELFNRNIISGTARLVDALMQTLLIGFGITAGTRIPYWLGPLPADTCTAPSFQWWYVVVFPISVICFNIMLEASPQQWFPMLVSAMFGQLIMQFTQGGLGGDTATMLASFGVGMMGSFYANRSRQPPLVMILSGIFMLLPGGMGVRGATAVLSNDILSGISLTFNMLTIGLVISVGLFGASVFMPNRFHSTRVTLL